MVVVQLATYLCALSEVEVGAVRVCIQHLLTIDGRVLDRKTYPLHTTSGSETKRKKRNMFSQCRKKEKRKEGNACNTYQPHRIEHCKIVSGQRTVVVV